MPEAKTIYHSLMGSEGKTFVDGREIDPTSGMPVPDEPEVKPTGEQLDAVLKARRADERIRREGEMRRRLEVAVNRGPYGTYTPERFAEALDYFAIGKGCVQQAVSDPNRMQQGASALIGLMENELRLKKANEDRKAQRLAERAQREMTEAWLKSGMTVEQFAALGKQTDEPSGAEVLAGPARRKAKSYEAD